MVKRSTTPPRQPPIQAFFKQPVSFERATCLACAEKWEVQVYPNPEAIRVEGDHLGTKQWVGICPKCKAGLAAFRYLANEGAKNDS